MTEPHETHGPPGGLDADGLPIRPRREVKTLAEPFRIQILSCGDAGVGKTCLIKRYCEKRFVTKYNSTIGVDFGVTTAVIAKRDVRVSFYDLAGDPSYLDVRKEFYHDTQGLLLIYDVTNKASFLKLPQWLDELSSEVDVKTLSVAVCGNKIDLAENRAVSEAEAQLWAKKQGFHYYEVSALSDMGVSDVFSTTFEYVLDAFNGAGVNRPAAPQFEQKHIDAISRVMNASSDTQILGISSRSSKAEINKAYRSLATALHPDKNRAPGSEDAFKALTKARTNLLTKSTG